MMNRFQWLALMVLLSVSAYSQGEKSLTLSEALRVAAERNLDVELERFNVNTSNIDLELTRSVYEPTVSSEVGTSSSEREASNTNQGEVGSSFSITGTSWNASVSKTEYFGLDWSVAFDNSVGEANYANSLGETYDSSLQLSFTQQLLKGFARDMELLKNEEYIARANNEISRLDLESRLVSIIQTAENAYWDLVLAKEQLLVNQASLKLAKQLYEQNKIKVDVGTLAPIELVNAEAEIASREQNIVTAENTVRAAEDALKKVMNLPAKDWDTRIVPADQLKIHEVEANFQMDFEMALKKRVEMRRNDRQMDSAVLSQKKSKDDLRPKLSFRGSYTLVGSSSPEAIFQENPLYDPTDPDSPARIPVGIRAPNYQDALSEVGQMDLPGWQVGLSLSWTPFNKQNKLNLAKANVAIRRQELASEQTKVSIMEEVRTAIRELEANKKSIQASEKTVKLRKENLRAEEQKFQNGLSTNYFVAERQKELTEAETNLLQSKVNYVKAVSTYHKALGRLLDERGVKVQ